MYGLEAVEVGFRKLVAVSVRKVGGIRMLVVARMPPLPWLGWFFLHLEEGGLPYASTARLICFLFLRQGIRCHRCHGPREASFFKEHHCCCCWLIFLYPEACGLWWPGWFYLLFLWQGNNHGHCYMLLPCWLCSFSHGIALWPGLCSP